MDEIEPAPSVSSKSESEGDVDMSEYALLILKSIKYLRDHTAWSPKDVSKYLQVRKNVAAPDMEDHIKKALDRGVALRVFQEQNGKYKIGKVKKLFKKKQLKKKRVRGARSSISH